MNMSSLSDLPPGHPGFHTEGARASPSPASLTEMISRNKFLEGKQLNQMVLFDVNFSNWSPVP
mgnify:CR=1 FL=1